jgi:hypothetical protein
LGAFRELRGPAQWWLFLRVLVFAAAVPLLFRLKLSVISGWLERRTRTKGMSMPDPARVEQTIRCVELARLVGSPLVRPTCLTRGVTHYLFLRRAGLPVSLCFGAAMKDGVLVSQAGHCWLVKDGEPFLENSDPRRQFLPIYSLPESVGQRVNGE